MNSLTPQDCYALMNSIVSQATGQTNLTATDTKSFVAVGETVLRTGTENTLNALSTVLANTIFSVRPYKGKFDILTVSAQKWGAMVRKIVPLYSEAEASDDWNTSTARPIEDNDSVDMYKIKSPKVVQLNFYGTKVLQKHITRFRDQLSLAFHNETEFAQFIDAIMIEFNNEVEMLNEAKARTTLLNFMAGINAMNYGSVVDLVAGYNTEYDSTYTREELLTEHIESFMKYVASEIKIYSDRLTDATKNYHANLTGYNAIIRHTPKAKQKMIMYNPAFIKAEANVYSSLFNPQYLDIGDFDGVNYWQSQDKPTEINITPNILNTTTGASADGEAQNIKYVLGLLFDTDALGVMPQFDYASTTPFNSAGGYYNMFMHWRFNSYCDYTENAILFVLGAGGE